jgi:predicted ATPase
MTAPSPQLLSDGFMALFGAPVASEEHARQAVLAAVALHRGLHHESPGHGVELQVRLGLHTGVVIVGSIEGGEQRNYTVVGDAITLVTDLQQTAAPGTIQLTDATYELVTGYCQCEDVGLVHVQGTAAPVRVYRVIGERGARSRLDVARQRGLTRFVGRERELSLLHACLTRVQAGHGQVVGIVGEPGLGKSRLLYEFFTSLEPGRVLWLEGHCVAHGQTVPYGPILEILRANFQIAAEDTPFKIREKLHQGVHQLDPDLKGILPFLETLFGLPGADEALRHLDPKDKRRRTFEALRAWTRAGGQRRPHVLVCENLHWIDRSSEDCLAALIEGLATLSVLVLTTHRPGYTVRWADKPHYTQLALEVLTVSEAEAMIATLLGDHDVSPALVRLMQEKTGGNPLFIEEVAHVLVERGLLARQHSGRHGQRDGEVEFPATIEDIIRARLDGLDEPVKRTVQTAAVIGRAFGLQLLTRLSAPTVEVRDALETLLHLELIHEQRVFPELEYRFKHAVIQEVAYQSLLGQRRRELHGAVGLAMEDLYPRTTAGAGRAPGLPLRP